MISIVIRTLNEVKHLDDAIAACRTQAGLDQEVEIVIVDSGSSDGTLAIAERHGCRIVKIRKEEFSFGRSLNYGCAAARGEILVFISGHCVPASDSWLKNLVAPLLAGTVAYSYGKQLGGVESRFSEKRLFAKYFPDVSQIPQKGFFCNNANAAVLKSFWEQFKFDEEITGLEDMALAKRIVNSGYLIGYCADAPVYHYHHESWKMIRRRYERESIALQKIMPEIQLTVADFFRYFVSAVLLDFSAAVEEKVLFSRWREIICFRFMQFYGAYRGNHETRVLNQAAKEIYFYPG